MERKESQRVELPQNARYELARCGEGNELFDKEVDACKSLIEEDDKMDNCYKDLLMSLLSKEETLIVRKATYKQNVMKQGDKSHLSERGRLYFENLAKALEKRPRPHKNVHENSRNTSEDITEPHKKRKGKEHLIEHEDAHENTRKTLRGKPKPHYKRKGKGLSPVHDDVREKAGNTFEDRTKRDLNLKRKGKEHLIEDDDVRENAVEENIHPDYEDLLKLLKEYKQNSSAVKSNKDSYSIDITNEKAKKQMVLDSRNTIIEISTDEDEGEDGEILKCSGRDCKNVLKNGREIIKKSPTGDLRNNVSLKESRNSEDERMEIKKSTSEFWNPARRNCREYEVGIEKRLAHEYRNASVSKKNNSESDDDDEDEDEDEDESEDSDREIIESASSQQRPFVPSVKFRDGGENGRASPNDSNAEFRRRVLEVISKPYDEKEYKNVKTEFLARCYTDYHPDLGKILMEYRNNRRCQLAIIRGFNFWLKNLTFEGAFKPWKDDICLAVEPQPLTPGNKSGT